jgi:hypothetical protein
MQVPCAHFFLTNPTNTPPRQHRLGKTFSAKNLSGSDSDTTYPIFFGSITGHRVWYSISDKFWEQTELPFLPADFRYF